MAGVLYEKKGNTAYITLNRSEKLNAIDYEIRKGLLESWERVNNDPEVWSAIITGAGKAFSVGADVSEGGKYGENLYIEPAFGFNVKKPLITAINGYCLAVATALVFNSDIRVAADNAIFGLPEVKVGMVAAQGLLARAAQHLPRCIALELLLTGDQISAQEAYRVGFINKIVSPEKLMATAEAYASKINELSPLVVQGIKEGFYVANEPSPQALAFSNSVYKRLLYSEDFQEGERAFVAKRKPQWKGK